jgi:hypothetical protein
MLGGLIDADVYGKVFGRLFAALRLRMVVGMDISSNIYTWIVDTHREKYMKIRKMTHTLRVR